jgi:hypothetical protein
MTLGGEALTAYLPHQQTVPGNRMQRYAMDIRDARHLRPILLSYEEIIILHLFSYLVVSYFA